MTTYKQIPDEDKVTNRSLLHEYIPNTGSIASGTYSDDNIKDYSHGLFQSVYDYPYLSSSANHVYDISMGLSPSSSLSGNVSMKDWEDKRNMYNEMAQMLVGYNEEGNIHEFDKDGNIAAGGEKMREVFFLTFSRLTTKDEIQKETFSLDMWVSGTVSGSPTHDTSLAGNSSGLKKLKEFHDRSGSYKVNSPMGEYDVLTREDTGKKVGHLYYQPGVAVLTASIFSGSDEFGAPTTTAYTSGTDGNGTGDAVSQHMVSESISGTADAFRYFQHDTEFNNTVELNSTIYFCRINAGDFNYSSNPTYLSESKIRVKEKSSDQPKSYATTVGLYSADNALLATAKLSEPLRIDSSTNTTLRVRQDF